VKITDTGAGFPMEVVERIKEGKAIDGVGLRGMYERVRELGGRFEIESTGMGTTVSAVLPLQRPEEKEAKEDSDEYKRVAGKPLETTDLRIQSPGEKNGAAEPRRLEARATRAPTRKGRQASQGSK